MTNELMSNKTEPSIVQTTLTNQIIVTCFRLISNPPIKLQQKHSFGENTKNIVKYNLTLSHVYIGYVHSH